MQKSNLLKRSLFLILLSIIMVNTQAQTGLNFQGVARTTSNLVVASQPISIKLSILQGSATGTSEYTEIRRVITNAQGLFTAVIGDTGAISTLGSFANINWKLSPKFLKIEMDPAAGTNFVTMGTTQFQYVPYAQYAKGVDADKLVGIVPVTLGGTGVNSLAGLKTSLAIDKINNTSDTDKPISNLTQTALDLKSNATDVATSLSLKLNKADTSTLSNRIDLKSNASDVTTSLALKANLASPTFTGTVSGITKTMVGLANVDNTSDVNKPVSTLAQTALDLKSNTSDVTTSLALKANLASPTFTGTVSGITSSMVGLGNVNNTTDLLKPISTATQTALDLKAPLASPTFTGTVAGIDKTMVGLGNVDNTSDVNKPVSTAAQTALDLKASSSDVTNGLALKANLASPTFTGTVSGITSSMVGLANVDNTTDAAKPISTLTQTGLALKAPLASPTFTGTAMAPTATAGTNTTQIATTAFVTGAITTANALVVPYTGATQAVDLGAYNLTVNGVSVGRGSGDISITSNTAIGASALSKNTTGSNNTANGVYALVNNTTGSNNSAQGIYALELNTTGSNNTSNGMYALLSNTTGSYNTAIGNNANVATGALTNATAIGAGAIVNTDNTIQLGNTSVTNVKTSGTITADAVTYPKAHGTAGQVLSTTGSGTLAWTTPSTTATAYSGTLPVDKGGTGLTAAGTNGQILTSTNAGTLTWTNATSVIYTSVLIGTQQWMQQNLEVVTYRDGTVIPQETDATAWAGLTTGAWCYYDNDPSSGYGKLYNWYAVNDPRGLAPQGWHIPTDDEWTTLGTFLGGNTAAGGKMKTKGTTRWTSPNTSATNQSGYAGLPGGLRGDGGAFGLVGNYGLWWSAKENGSTRAWNRYLENANGNLVSGNYFYKHSGFSVRCLRD
jgi:uncharacterized protein (TIGR02145 family)